MPCRRAHAPFWQSHCANFRYRVALTCQPTSLKTGVSRDCVLRSFSEARNPGEAAVTFIRTRKCVALAMTDKIVVSMQWVMLVWKKDC